MPDRPIFHPEVYAEIDTAIDYGLQNWPELVGDLLDEFDSKISLIIDEDPDQRRELKYGVKRINLAHRFPYHIIYKYWQGSIWLIAFAHHK